MCATRSTARARMPIIPLWLSARAKTKDILHVKRLLGHKKLENTEIYTHLTEFENEEYHSATAITVEEAKKLIESGFEYVTNMDDIKLFRRRK